jgi:hypothetical protein
MENWDEPLTWHYFETVNKREKRLADGRGQWWGIMYATIGKPVMSDPRGRYEDPVWPLGHDYRSQSEINAVIKRGTVAPPIPTSPATHRLRAHHISCASQRGESNRTIAEWAGLSVARVRQIIQKEQRHI